MQTRLEGEEEVMRVREILICIIIALLVALIGLAIASGVSIRASDDCIEKADRFIEAYEASR